MVGEQRSKVRIGYVATWTAVGLGLLAAASALVGGWLEAQFWSAVLVNLGTTICLAGFLVWLERRLIANTRAVAREAASTAASETATAVSEAATAAAEEATRAFANRLDAIQERFERQRVEQEAEEDALISGLAGEISYARMLSALSMAHSFSAAAQTLYATAGELGDAPVVGIELIWEDADWELEVAPPADYLRLSVDTALLGTAYVVEADWFPDDDPVEVLTRLRNSMIRAGYGPAAQRLAFDRWFELVRVGLEEGLHGRRGNDRSWRTSGQLYDVLSSDFVVSEYGLEHRGHGLVAARSVLAESIIPGSGRQFAPPSAPDWIDTETWNRAVNRARARLRAGSPWGF